MLPMLPTSSMWLIGESREHPMHVGSLQLFVPPDGADAVDVRRMFEAAARTGEVADLFRKRAQRSLSSLGQWGWEPDEHFDIEHHVRNSALPSPGRVLELLAMCSRLHSNLLDRHRPLWETHLIEGLADGRFAVYFKVHHAVVDGVSALRLLSRALSDDPDERGRPAPWALGTGAAAPHDAADPPSGAGIDAMAELAGLLRGAAHLLGDVAGLVPALARGLQRGREELGGAIALNAPRSILNGPITGARRFAAQSWPMERVRAVGRASGATVNDVVLALCSGALRAYLSSLDALPDRPLIAMVPVSLHNDQPREADGGGNAIGAVMCNLGTHLTDPAQRLAQVRQSMSEGKDSMRGRSQLQLLALSALGLSPLVTASLLGLSGTIRPACNVVISNVPGPTGPLFWNGARLDGFYPLSIPADGLALNITVTSYSDNLAFGLTGDRRSLPHLQRLLGYLDDELGALEVAVA